MTNKEYLKQLWTLDREIDSLTQEMEDLRIRAECIGSPGMEQDRVKTSLPSDAKFTQYVHEIARIHDMVESKQMEYVDLRKRIMQSIANMPIADERIVLRRRYILHQTWEQIAECMNASVRTVTRWHGSALVHFRQS